MKQPSGNFEQLIIELKDKMITLNILPFDTDIDVDDIIKIDYHNIVGEILTFNVLFNRISNLKAEQQSIVSHSEMDIDVLEAQLYEEYKKKGVGEKSTVKDIEAAVTRDIRLTTKKKMHFERVKGLAYLDSLYWSAQNKCGLLKVLSDKLRPEEFSGELLSDTINGVMIKASQKLIK